MSTETVTLRLPCPFCGKEPHVWSVTTDYGHGDQRHHIQCDNPDCWIRPYAIADTGDEVLARWNRRANTPPEGR